MIFFTVLDDFMTRKERVGLVQAFMSSHRSSSSIF